MNLQFQGKYIITGKIICKTGLHIGGTQEGIEIGGIDNIVIRDSLTETPYIPGSSLKGKLRHLLEWALDKVYSDNGKFPVHSCVNDPQVVKLQREAEKLKDEERKKKDQEKDNKLKGLISTCPICLIFGSSGSAVGLTPTRLTVRDSFPEKTTVDKWKQWLGEYIYTEIKTENTIDRVTSEANPRSMERVPAGSEFSFEIIFDIYQDQDRELLKYLFTAMHLLENSALGGSGTRGSGKIQFAITKQQFRSIKYYMEGVDSDSDKDLIVSSLNGKSSVSELIKNFPVIKP